MEVQKMKAISEKAGVLVVTESKVEMSSANSFFSKREGIPAVHGGIKHVLHQNS
jgi:hypothetical protein